MIVLTPTERQVLLDALEDSFNIAKEYSELEVMCDVVSCIDMLRRIASRPVNEVIP